MLRTNLEGETAEELWSKYIQLTEAGAAFRALKSELAIRPLFHQIEPRAKAHILVAFLGYALWVTLRHLLMRKGSAFSPAKALSLLGTLVSADVVLPTTDGREIRRIFLFVIEGIFCGTVWDCQSSLEMSPFLPR